jgi:single-strand DNA-binding protein
MSKSLNKVMLIGNVGNAPETKTTSNGKYFSTFSLATSISWKDKETNEKKEATEWHKISAFGKLAEIIDRYVQKGDKIYIDGSLKTSKWEDSDGVLKYRTEIIANNMIMLGVPTKNITQSIANDDLPF